MKIFIYIVVISILPPLTSCGMANKSSGNDANLITMCEDENKYALLNECNAISEESFKSYECADTKSLLYEEGGTETEYNYNRSLEKLFVGEVELITSPIVLSGGFSKVNVEFPQLKNFSDYHIMNINRTIYDMIVTNGNIHDRPYRLFDFKDI